MATQKAAATSGINFGDLNMYSSSAGIPAGRYALEFTVQMYQFKNQAGNAVGTARLGVVVKAHSLTEAEHRGENAYSQFYSMGSKAHLSFQPDAATGKSLVVVPDAPNTNLPASTNWAILLKSLYDSGLPVGIFTNDLSVLDGVHVQTAQIPEPEERKGFQSATSEVQQEPRKEQKISVVTEILEDGKPWEGGGGVPTADQPKTTAKTAAKPAAKAAAKPAAEDKDLDRESVDTAAISTISEYLVKHLDGAPKLALRTSVFTAAKEQYGEKMAQAIQNQVFSSDENLNRVLSDLGFVAKGPKIETL